MTHPTDVDKYQIIRPLGSGNFGQVYHAFDRALRADKAIKILKAKDPDEFLAHLKEAQILRRCRHKHIVSINEANVFDVEGEPRVVLDLEFVAEGSLEKALENRWISIRDAVTHIRGALVGLEHAHSQGFLHRDIKPGNILLAPSGAKLSDFGLATEPGTSLYGSPRGYITHLPPEYFTDRATSVLTDVYATGVTLFRAASNISDWRTVSKAVPNSRKHVEEGTLIRAIGYEGFVPVVLRRIISKACASDPNRRLQTAHDFGQQLDKLRFDIDWVRTGDAEWHGESASGSHVAFVDNNTNTLTVLKNGRRVTVHCQKFASFSSAIAALHSHVADTTFA